MGQAFTHNFDADGDSPVFQYNGSKGAQQTKGDFDGGALTLLSSAFGVSGPFVAVSAFGSVTANGEPILFSRETPHGMNYKWNLSGSGGSPDLDVIFIQGEGK